MSSNDEIDVQDDDSGDDEAFVTYDIAAYPADYTLSVIAEMWANGDIVIPVFQRKFVWTIKQSSMLIESLLMGLPVPQAFFYVTPENKNQVIDGLQRLMSVVYFFQGYFGDESYQGKRSVFRLTGLNEKSPYRNKSFSDLDESDQRKLKGRVLRVINIRQLGPKDDDTSAYHIFERLNTGGTPLTAQEIRHCVYHGVLVEALSALNNLPAWRKILGKVALDRHQKDVEMVLRCLAFATRAAAYDKPMKEFLNKTMAANRSAASAEVRRFLDRFPVVCEQVVAQLGERPFNIYGNRINASALDSVMACLISSGEAVPHNLHERYSGLRVDPEFLGTLSVSTSDTAIVRKRLSVVARHLRAG